MRQRRRAPGTMDMFPEGGEEIAKYQVLRIRSHVIGTVDYPVKSKNDTLRKLSSQEIVGASLAEADFKDGAGKIVDGGAGEAQAGALSAKARNHAGQTILRHGF